MGIPVPGKHAACHTDLFSRHDGKSIAYSGGWHDAGDLSQQTLQTGDVTFSLLETYNRLKTRNTPLAARLEKWKLIHTEKPLWRRLSCQQYGTAYLARRHPEYIG